MTPYRAVLLKCDCCNQPRGNLYFYSEWNLRFCHGCIREFQIKITNLMGRAFIDSIPNKKWTFFHAMSPVGMWCVGNSTSTSINYYPDEDSDADHS